MNQQQRSCGRFYSSKQPAVGMDGDATFMEVREGHMKIPTAGCHPWVGYCQGHTRYDRALTGLYVFDDVR